MTRKKRLGRGLDALLNAAPGDSASDVGVLERAPLSLQTAALTTSKPKVKSTSNPPELEEGEIVHLNVYDVEDNPFQPRRIFSESEIASLSESLKEHDILQPILVRKVNGRFQLISGERRLRAAIKANWKTIPARVREADDRLVSELAIVENLQRKDLNPIEKAMSFRRYIDEHRCTQEDLASRLKIDRSTIANLIRLLELPPNIRTALQESKISAGHARTLLPLGEARLQTEFCDRIMREGMSVRATERAVSDWISNQDAPLQGKRKKRVKDLHVETMEQKLKESLGTKVQIKQGANTRGQIVISYRSPAEFERIRDLLLK